MAFRLVTLVVALSVGVGRAEEPPKPGAERDVAMPNGVTMRFCWVPAGKAKLGMSPGATLDGNLEPYDYTAKGFWLGKYEVTRAEWQGVMGTNPSYFSATGKGAAKVAGLKTDRFPVDQVSFKDCENFVEKSAVKGLRVPHEDEWEYACRGGKGFKQSYYFGDALNGKQANCFGELPFGTPEKGQALQRVTAVGSYAKLAPHPWGLCDMHGNVQEWCANLYTMKPERRCLRGGSWNTQPRACRSASRYGDAADYPGITYGVRLCLD